MFLPCFSTEQWMTNHEGNAVYNLTDTCISSFSLQDLLAMDKKGHLQNLRLDYGSITGDESLKNEIVSLYQRGTKDNVTTASGCNQANEMVMETLLEKEDYVIAYTPGYQSYVDMPKSIGCNVIVLPLYEANGWQPSIKELQQAFEYPIKMVILNMPGNPTGVMFKEDYIDELLKLCKKCNTWILADEVYRNPDQSSISDMYDFGISTASLSKLFSLAGLRFGWIKGNEEIIKQINERRDYSIISTGPLTDACALIALENKDYILKRAEKRIQKSKQVINAWLQKETRCSWVEPQGGTVSFLKYNLSKKSEDLCESLQKKHGVFFVPGSCFNNDYHVRLSLTADEKTLADGLQLFSRFLDEIS